MKIKEVIVVEGRHDTQRIREAVDADTIETGGSAINEATLIKIEAAYKKRGIIVFTDPDSPGDRIRTIINQRIPGCKNAYLLKKDARTTKKVGIEHASVDVIREALLNVSDGFDENELSISFNDYIDLGLMNHEDSEAKRAVLAEAFHIGKANGKTTYKRLNAMHVTKEEIIRVLEEKYEKYSDSSDNK